MPHPFIQLSIDAFAERLAKFTFTRVVTAVHVHHTWSPTQADYNALPPTRQVEIIEGMYRFHTAPPPNGRGWSDIAQHVSIAPDGTIWTGRDWNRLPASATGHNDGAFMFETIGNFDTGHDRLTGAQRRAVVEVIARVQLKCKLPASSMHFHREFTDEKTCPGNGITHAEILAEVVAARDRIQGQGAKGAPRSTARLTPRSMSRYAAPATGRSTLPFAESQVIEDAEERGDPDGGGDAGALGASAPRGGPSPEDITALRPYVVNLRQGRFSGGGKMTTSPADVDAIFRDHLPRALREARDAGQPLRLLFWAHGGLVSEEQGLETAKHVVPWWRSNHVYPIYFVWETGLWETITNLLKGRRELELARGFSDITDRILEGVVRDLGGDKIWGGMKHGAAASVASDGGALYVARHLAAFCREHGAAVEVHAAGHSAGSIFHSYFVPTALTLGVSAFRTLAFLAPAIRTREFLDRLAEPLGNGLVESLAMFTMRKELEKDDNCARLYRKSLLYLIHNALEAVRSEPILGLQESVEDADDTDAAAVRRIFGLAGNQPTRHHVVWSTTTADVGFSSSRSRSHGGFDNERYTMVSVLRRVLDDETGPVAPFPADAQRDFTFSASLGDDAGHDDAGGAAAQPVAAPSPLPASAGKRAACRALCVGINAYPGNARLSGCVADAKAWRDGLRALGFQAELLFDEDATRANLMAKLRELLHESRAGDALVFQYSGHGTSLPDDDADDESDTDEAIVPVDYAQSDVLLDDELFEIFDALPEGVSLTCFFDSCFSHDVTRMTLSNTVRGIQAGGDDARPRFLAPTPEMVLAHRRRRSAGRGLARRSLRDAEALKHIVFSACRSTELAWERGGHGVFTTRAVPLLRDAFAQHDTNARFFERVHLAFAHDDAQHPGVDGPVQLHAQRFLGCAPAGSLAGATKTEPADPATERVAQARALLGRADALLDVTLLGGA